MTWLLGFGIPIIYVALGSAVAFLVWDIGVDPDCRRRPRGEHDYSYHDVCYVVTVLSGLLWPIAAITLSVWVLMKGTKQPKKTTIGRAQRKARKVQAYIEQMEADLGIGVDK